MEECFGLRPAEVKAAFLASKPLEGEDPTAFILRMEDNQVRVSITVQQCWDRLVPGLPEKFLVALDAGNSQAAMSGNSGCVDWPSLVHYARAQVRGVKLARSGQARIAGFGVAPKGAPLPGAIAVAAGSKVVPVTGEKAADMQAHVRIMHWPPQSPQMNFSAGNYAAAREAARTAGG